MRCSPFFVASALPLAVRAVSLLDWITGSKAALSTEVAPHRIAVIGAGAGGSSAAFWIQKAKSRAGVEVHVDVFEREDYVGGRSTVVYPYNDTNLYPVELGASIYVEANKNLWRAAQEFNLGTYKFLDNEDKTGFWDGEQFVFSMEQGSGLFGWWDSVKALWRYGYKAPTRTRAMVNELIQHIFRLYSPGSPHWNNVTNLVQELNWTSLVAQTASEVLDSQGLYRLWTREIVEAATRVNYGQNSDEIHSIGGFVSMAADNAFSIKGGNFQMFQYFLAHSGASVHLNTTVLSISQTTSGAWSVTTSADPDTPKTYDDVIIAAPFHQTGISLAQSAWSLSKTHFEPVPPQPYVHLHVTLLTTTSPHPDPEYFGLKAGSSVPPTILTTYEGVRKGGKEPEFNSLTYHGAVGPGREQEFVVKIFSKERVDDEWLTKVFSGNVGWVYRKEWNAYPYLTPTSTFPPVVLAEGLYYANSFEPLISTMETQTLSNRNVVDLIFRHRFKTDICGTKVDPSASSHIPESAQETLREEGFGLTDKPDDFVFGWDC